MSIWIILMSLLMVSGVQANEISLLEEGVVIPAVKKEEAIINKQEISESKEDPESEDDFKQMDDFIKNENEKLKGIKLLNLDLEMANLELKRREIEQKITQLNKSWGSLPIGKQEYINEDKSDNQEPKVAAVFQSNAKKQATLDFNGRHINVQEGQEVRGLMVKAINSKGITIQYQDGKIKELNIL
jgi:type IV pilus biogenesis protein PilP